MAKGYGWSPGKFGYEVVGKVRRLKDAALKAGVPVVHCHSMRRPSDNSSDSSPMRAGTTDLEVIPELEPNR